MYVASFLPRKEILRFAAEALERFLAEKQLTKAEYCESRKLPKRTFERFMENRNASKAVGHTMRGPRKLIQQIVDFENENFPDDVLEALRRVLYYSDDVLLGPSGRGPKSAP